MSQQKLYIYMAFMMNAFKNIEIQQYEKALLKGESNNKIQKDSQTPENEKKEED